MSKVNSNKTYLFPKDHKIMVTRKITWKTGCNNKNKKDMSKNRKSRICYTTKAMFIFINKLSFHTGNIKLQKAAAIKMFYMKTR